MTGQLIGYARVSAVDQNPDLQERALKAAGCERIFTEKLSGALKDRPELAACLDYMREGDVLVVYKLDRLGRSLMNLVEAVNGLAEFERDTIRERAAAGRAAARGPR